jgi:hypothetical protein
MRHDGGMENRATIRCAQSIWPVLALLLTGAGAAAQTMFADVLIDYRSSGAGPVQEPYGGVSGTSDGEPLPLSDWSMALDGNKESWVSLPTGASITVGFAGGIVFDGPGDDLLICESGAASELANVFVSSDHGATFSLLGIADGGTVTRMDLARINFSGKVNAVKITGLDAKGWSPGFDVCYVEGLEGSVQLAGPIGPGGSVADEFNREPAADALADLVRWFAGN